MLPCCNCRRLKAADLRETNAAADLDLDADEDWTVDDWIFLFPSDHRVPCLPSAAAPETRPEYLLILFAAFACRLVNSSAILKFVESNRKWPETPPQVAPAFDGGRLDSSSLCIGRSMSSSCCCIIRFTVVRTCSSSQSWPVDEGRFSKCRQYKWLPRKCLIFSYREDKLFKAESCTLDEQLGRITFAVKY